jgi:hypothetical protein
MVEKLKEREQTGKYKKVKDSKKKRETRERTYRICRKDREK